MSHNLKLQTFIPNFQKINQQSLLQETFHGCVVDYDLFITHWRSLKVYPRQKVYTKELIFYLNITKSHLNKGHTYDKVIFVIDFLVENIFDNYLKVIQSVSRIQINKASYLFLSRFQLLFDRASFLEAGGAVLKIGSSMKPNNHWKIQLAQID